MDTDPGCHHGYGSRMSPWIRIQDVTMDTDQILGEKKYPDPQLCSWYCQAEEGRMKTFKKF